MRTSNFFGTSERQASVDMRQSKYGTSFGTTQMNVTKKPETNLRKSMVDGGQDVRKPETNLRKSIIDGRQEVRKPAPQKRFTTITENGRDLFKITGGKGEPKGRDNSNIHIQENYDDRDVDELLGKS
jgi:hypothetical protein